MSIISLKSSYGYKCFETKRAIFVCEKQLLAVEEAAVSHPHHLPLAKACTMILRVPNKMGIAQLLTAWVAPLRQKCGERGALKGQVSLKLNSKVLYFHLAI